MNRVKLAFACFLFVGCAGRLNTDLLQARIREQSVQMAETQREIVKARSDLKQARLEAERLKSELKNVNGQPSDALAQPVTQISKLHIYPLASGGLNRDQQPGDDAIVVQFAPFDLDNEPIKVPGQVEIVLLDPKLPETNQELGRWSFSADECRDHWTRGITSSGFQFTLPIEEAVQHSDLVVKLKFKPSKDRRYEASQIVKVAVPTDTELAENHRVPRRLAAMADDLEVDVPPVGVTESSFDDADASDWDTDEGEASKSKPGHTVLHSTNWTDASIPVLR